MSYAPHLEIAIFKLAAVCYKCRVFEVERKQREHTDLVWKLEDDTEASQQWQERFQLNSEAAMRVVNQQAEEIARSRWDTHLDVTLGSVCQRHLR